MNVTPKIIRAYQGETQNTPCAWLMRQAGRYLPEYRALRAEAGSFLQLCYTPEWAAEVTLQPLRRFDLDAAILFSDILVVPHAMGQSLDFKAGEGPVLGPLDVTNLSTSRDAIESFTAPVFETVKRVRAELNPDQALIGFCGAPWTVACYMIDRRGKTGFPKARQMASDAPDDLQVIIDHIVTASLHYLRGQIDAGAQAIQIFDSWAAYLDQESLMRWSTQPIARLVKSLKNSHPHIPIIGFPRGMTGSMKEWVDHTNVDVLALGTDADRKTARELDICLQGNLSPELLLQGGQAMVDEARSIITDLNHKPFVFNLGHGVIKETSPAHVAELINAIKG